MIDYRKMLLDAAEPKYAEFCAKLTPGKENILGVRIPAIRKIVKEILKDDWRPVLESEPEFYEEEMVQGLIIATAPVTTDERISMTDRFIGGIDNWAVCDVFCCSWKCPKEDEDRAFEYFGDLIDSDEEFIMRVSIIARMGMCKDRKKAEMLLKDLATHDHPGYYYKMGSAWAVSTIYVYHPDLAEELLRSGRLEIWTHNKAIQKIRESYRVSNEDKERLRELKRRAP